MANTSATSPGTAASVFYGGMPWVNYNNCKIEDGSLAVSTNPTNNTTAGSDYLKATNFGFSIPANSTINGILVEIKESAYYSGGKPSEYTGVTDNTVNIIKSDGSLGSVNKATANQWSYVLGYVSYGGASDLWGETWTASNINDSDFGVSLSTSMTIMMGAGSTISAQIDHVRITVYYTPTHIATVSGSVSSSGSNARLLKATRSMPGELLSSGVSNRKLIAYREIGD